MAPPHNRPWWIRLLLSLIAGLGSAVLVAIAIAVVDLYLTGHGLRPRARLCWIGPALEYISAWQM